MAWSRAGCDFTLARSLDKDGTAIARERLANTGIAPAVTMDAIGTDERWRPVTGMNHKRERTP